MRNWGEGCVNHFMGAYSSACITPHNICNFQYYRDMLATKILSLFKFTLPKDWPEFVPYWVMLCGFCAVVDTPQYGIIPIPGTLSGQGIWNQPTEVIVSQPLVYFPKPLKIGKDTEVIRISPFYNSASPIINHYAEMLALADDAIHANLINSRIGHVFSASTPAIAKSIKTVFDQIASGLPAVVDSKVTADLDGSKGFEMFGKPGDHVITDKLLDNKRNIIRDFCRDVGIHTGNETKRERQTISEIEMNDQETERHLSYWLRHITESLERVNTMFNLNVGVEIDGNYNRRDIDAQGNPIT